MTFSETLKYLRQEKQITQKQLAYACKLSPQCICNLEQGTRNPTGSTIRTLAVYFGVSADYLLGLEDDFGVRTTTVPAVMGDSYSADEHKLVGDYRDLNPAGKRLVNETIKTLLTTSGGSEKKKNKM